VERHLVAAVTLERWLVERAPAAASQELVGYGPDPLTIQDALRIYREVVRPELRCVTIPTPVMAAANRLFMRGKLTPTLQLMRILERLDDGAIRRQPNTFCELRRRQFGNGVAAPSSPTQAWESGDEVSRSRADRPASRTSASGRTSFLVLGWLAAFLAVSI
jgi:hypothetical protein